MANFWNALPRPVQIALAGGIPGLTMAAEARQKNWSGVASLLWGGLAGFSGVTLTGILTGDNFGPFVTYAEMLEQLLYAHPYVGYISGGLGLVTGMIAGGLLDDIFALDFLPAAVLSTAKKNNPLATDLTDASIIVFVSWSAISVFVGLNGGIGFVYTMQAGSCAFEKMMDWSNCYLNDNSTSCNDLKKSCEFGIAYPLFPQGE